jgi:hypothetical protein
MKEDFQLKFKNFVKRIAKHAKWAVSFCIIKNETCKTGCFAKHEISRNGKFVSRNNETRFASSFVKQKVKRVSLETLVADQDNFDADPDPDPTSEKNRIWIRILLYEKFCNKKCLPKNGL